MKKKLDFFFTISETIDPRSDKVLSSMALGNEGI